MRAFFSDWDPLLKTILNQVKSVQKWKLLHLDSLDTWVHGCVRHNTKVVHLVVALLTVKAYSDAANCAVKVASDCLLIGLMRFDKLTPYGIVTVRYC